MIKADGGNLTMRNNCFINNSIIGFGVVEAFQGAKVISEGNYGDFVDGLTCSFIAAAAGEPIATTTSKSDAVDFVCSGYEASTCSIDWAPPPREPNIATLPPSPAESSATSAAAPSTSSGFRRMATFSLIVASCLPYLFRL